MNTAAKRIAIEGDLTIYTVREWRDCLARVLDSHTLLEVDLAGVEECDTAGVQLLAMLKGARRVVGQRHASFPFA